MLPKDITSTQRMMKSSVQKDICAQVVMFSQKFANLVLIHNKPDWVCVLNALLHTHVQVEIRRGLATRKNTSKM
jgi:hypothetical protein